MSFKRPDIGYQFFRNVLKGKGVDQPTIDFVWGHGESSFLWKQWFGEVTKDGMRKLGELTETVNVVEPKKMPPLEHGSLSVEFDGLSFWRGEVTFYKKGVCVGVARPHLELGGWYPDHVTHVQYLDDTTVKLFASHA